MRPVFLTLLVLSILFQVCRGQVRSNPKEIFNKEFNWRIEIPEGFDSVSTEQWMKMQNRGADAIKKTYNEEVENNAKTIFVFRSDQFNLSHFLL